MILYSLKGQYPQPLPDRIILSNGFTRTGGIYAPEEIADAGYFAVEIPSYDPNTHRLNWNGTEFELDLIPPPTPTPTPTPDWLGFSQLMLQDPEFNEFYNQLFIAKPLIACSVQTALLNASLGETGAFAVIWGLISPDIPLEYKNKWGGYAQNSHLPSDFIEILLS